MFSRLDRRSRTLYLLIVLEMAAYGAVLAVFGSSLPRVIREFGWTYLAAGAVLGAGSAGFFLATLACGYLLRRFRTKALLLAGSVLAAAGLTLFARFPGPLPNLACNLAVGLGQGLIEVVSELEVIHLEREGKSRLMNLAHAVFAVGAIASPGLTAAFLGRGVDWQLLFPAAAGLIAALAVFAAAFRFPRDVRGFAAPGDHAGHGALALLRREPLLVLITLLIFFYVGSELGTSNWISEYFVVSLGLPAIRAAFAVSVLWAGLLAGRLVISFAWHGQRHERLMLVLAAACTVALPALLAVRAPWLAFTLVFVTGLGLSGIYPLGISLTGQHFGTGMAVGIATTGAGIGSFTFPFLMSGIAQAVGLRGGFLLFAGANLLVVVVALLIGRSVSARINRTQGGSSGTPLARADESPAR
ncbi:MAG: MFS transporter [Spirochaetes bacterium]|nr:MFS transporter [Spirochaetota bacterium]